MLFPSLAPPLSFFLMIGSFFVQLASAYLSFLRGAFCDHSIINRSPHIPYSLSQTLICCFHYMY